jgi:hypothetical protein
MTSGALVPITRFVRKILSNKTSPSICPLRTTTPSVLRRQLRETVDQMYSQLMSPFSSSHTKVNEIRSFRIVVDNRGGLEVVITDIQTTITALLINANHHQMVNLTIDRNFRRVTIIIEVIIETWSRVINS